MRALRTRQHAYILNLAHELSFPIAGDVASSPSWKAISERRAALGKRSLEAYMHRPAEELYDVVNDPQQLVNLASAGSTGTPCCNRARRWKSGAQRPKTVACRTNVTV